MPRPGSFSDLCEHLARDGGGYTLWVGAGASIAASRGGTPSWESLVAKLLAEAEAAGSWVRPENWPAMGMPDRLDCIFEALTHATFRRRLREELVAPLLASRLDDQVVLDQAIVGARASNIVSFNIEMISSLAFGVGQGGTFVPRTYLPSTRYAPPVVTLKPGPIGNTVYYPHGLLDVQGACVMTRSEYDLHGASLAAGAAVNLCLGGDLLVLGMSLSDRYLRDAILRGRQWIRDVYWVNATFPHAEWARVARVTCVHANHDEVWARIAESAIKADNSGTLGENRKKLANLLPTGLQELQDSVQNLPEQIEKTAHTIVGNAAFTLSDLQDFAGFCVDVGLGVPDVIRSDSRWR